MFRLRTSFRHKKNRLLSDIKMKNSELFNFLQRDQASRLSRISRAAPSKGGNSVISSFLDFQDQAQSVFKGFQLYWSCSCTCAGIHPCRITARDSDMKVLIDTEAEQAHIKVQLEKTVKQKTSSKSSATVQVATKHEEVAVLRSQVSLKNRLSKMKVKGPKSILKLTASALAALSNPAEAKSDTTSSEPSQKRYAVLFCL